MARVNYRSGGIAYRRIAFASHPAGALVVRLTADRPGAYTGRLWLTDRHGAPIEAEGDRLRASGRLENGLEYESQVLLSRGGRPLSPITARTATSPGDRRFPGGKRTALPANSLAFEAPPTP